MFATQSIKNYLGLASAASLLHPQTMISSLSSGESPTVTYHIKSIMWTAFTSIILLASHSTI